ncbi:MAG: hypothetical protein LBV23_06500 [Deltaproteobacteria bacterium]|nr:hypothetical protein [Deltaproteobacteria bacterium]
MRGEPNEGDLFLWSKIMEASQKCLDLDREIFLKIKSFEDGQAKEVDDFVDPALWENYIEARRELFDYATNNIKVLTRDRRAPRKASRREGDKVEADQKRQKEIESRIVNSLKEMLLLEEKLTNYLSDNLSVIKETIEELSKNQPIFTKYSRGATKPQPGYLSSQA